MADNLVQVAGNVTRDPVEREGSKGPFVVFGVATNVAYGEGGTRFVDVLIGKPALQELVLKHLHRGSAVVVEGYLNEKEYQGKAQFSLSGFRVGFVEWINPNRVIEPAEEEEDL